jgi:hypothetical protein
MRCRKIQTRLTRSCTLHARKLNPEPNWKRNSIAVLAACSLGGCMTQRGIPAAGTVVESRVVTTVDTQLAKSFLETSLAERAKHDQTKVARALRAQFDQRTMSWELLRDLTHETSVDFATLYFIRRTLMDQRNAQWQSRFAAFISKQPFGFRLPRRAVVGPSRCGRQGPLENARAFRSQRWLDASG